jgi:hypothetical protein
VIVNLLLATFALFLVGIAILMIIVNWNNEICQWCGDDGDPCPHCGAK